MLIKTSLHFGFEETLIGYLDIHINEGTQKVSSSFQYVDTWKSSAEGFELSPHMPFYQGVFFYKETDEGAFPAPLLDAMPDRWGQELILRLIKSKQASQYPAIVHALLDADDRSRIGAIRLKFLEKGDFITQYPALGSSPNLVDLSLLEHSVNHLERGTADFEMIRRLNQMGSSLGGARPKCSVFMPNGDLYIAKFTSERDERNIELAEVMTAKLAKLCHINACEAQVFTKALRPIALFKRFDRVGQRRIHYISAQTMLGATDSENRNSVFSYVDMADYIRTYCASNAGKELEELFKRIAFQILVSNNDDHLKNHGFLYDADKHQWSLAPMFDVNPMPDRMVSLKTPILSDGDVSADLEKWLSCCEFFNVSLSQARIMLKEMAEGITQQWKLVAKQVGMSSRDIKVFEPAFNHEQMRFALGC